MDDLGDRIEACTLALLEAARAADAIVSGDLRVSEANAAMLLGLSAGTMRNWRQQGEGPRAFSTPMDGCRVSYRLVDLATWVELGLER